MISLIIGRKGTGKTKKLIDRVNEAATSSPGNVVCIEKEQKLTFDISHSVRLIDTDVYGVNGFDELYAFMCGICAANYDVTHIFVDATLKIGGRDYEGLIHFLDRISVISEETNTKLVFTIACDMNELPDGIHHFAVVD